MPGFFNQFVVNFSSLAQNKKTNKNYKPHGHILDHFEVPVSAVDMVVSGAVGHQHRRPPSRNLNCAGFYFASEPLLVFVSDTPETFIVALEVQTENIKEKYKKK